MASIRRRRAILHIGTGKTGSTTIQNLLAANRERLLAQGFAYPSSPGARNHLQLAIYAADERRAAKLARIASEAASAGGLRQRLAARLGAEMAALPEGVHTVIFSSEHLSNQAASAGQVARLKALLDTWFDEYRILVYLRRQDEYAVSLYSTLLRAGQTGLDVLPGPEADARHDWASLLDRWGEAFGRAALLPRLFDRSAFEGGDLLADMRAATGLGPLPVQEEAAALNPSLTAPAQEFLRRLNIAARRGAPAEEEPGAEDAEEEEAEPGRYAAEEAGKAPTFIRQFLGTRFAGPGRRPSRAEAEAFVARHAAGNERIRAEFFPGRATLFSPDFSRYPEQGDPLPGGEALVEVAAAVALAQSAELNAAVADMAARRGRERAQEAPEEARRLFRRALAKQAGNLAALRGLLDLAADAGDHEEVEHRLARALALEPERAELLALRRRLHRLGRAADEPGAGPGEERAATAASPESRAARRAARAAAGKGGPPGAPPPGQAAGPATGAPAQLTPEERAARQERRAERLRRREAATRPG